MKVFLEAENKYVEVNEREVDAILKELDINPTTVIVSKNGNLVLGNTKVIPEDKLIIFSVVSGG